MYSCPPRTTTTGLAARHGVEIAAVRQAVFLELRLVPVAVGDDDAAARTVSACGDRRQQSSIVRARERSTPGAAARVVQVIVGEARDDGPAAQIDRRRRRAGEFLIARVVPTAVNFPSEIASASTMETARRR